ncbi:DNA-processing protein DprA [Nonomuraea dietziae]|uniref:DNA-processing protein DprA n=1 Tax=Nonomuraea dietziae TaxID=65515 RepID=UPI003431DC97
MLALTRHAAGAWHPIARIIEESRSALRLLDGDVADVPHEDRAYAAEVIARVRPGDLTWAEDLIISARTHDVRLVTVLDQEYPGNLDFAHDPQPFLWVRGRLRADDCRALTIVGEGGTAITSAREAAQAVTQAGLTVVAGLRSEVDVAVHETVLVANGRSLAALDQGIIAPMDAVPHATMAKEIARHGAVVSQFWPEDAPSAQTVAMSRIVTSGLAAAVYVVDGTEDSGPAQQARVALNHGRHLFVPHQLHQEQPWVRRLAYRGGVTVVHSLDDLLAAIVNLVDMDRQPTIF